MTNTTAANGKEDAYHGVPAEGDYGYPKFVANLINKSASNQAIYGFCLLAEIDGFADEKHVKEIAVYILFTTFSEED